ncbi:MAG: hypothetical protein M1292_04890 [Bacteroidetes bacterium]|nr:hypothetical protein [Bacteroidota bacterium]
MRQTFKLKKGEILFDEDKIIIKDDAKMQKWSSSLITFMGIMILILFFLKSYKTGAQFDFWFELIFILLGILLLTILLLRSVKSDIALNEVKSMKIKQVFGNKFLDIKLVNNRLRRVSDIQNAKELEKYVAINFDTK